MKKDNKTILIIGAIIALLFIGYYFQSLGKCGGLGWGNNGCWKSDVKQCWATEDSLSPKKIDESGIGMGTCCFDKESYQVDCADSTRRLSKSPVTLFEVYSYPTQPGRTGEFSSIAHRIDISNTGGVGIDKVWISSANWVATPANTNVARVNGNYSNIIGVANGQPVAAGQVTSFTPGPFYLSGLDASGAGTTYNLTMIVQATAYSGDLNASNTYTNQWFKVKKESLGFSVAIAY